MKLLTTNLFKVVITPLIFLIFLFFLFVTENNPFYSINTLFIHKVYACSVAYTGAMNCAERDITGCYPGVNAGDWTSYDCKSGGACGAGWECSSTGYENALTCLCPSPPPPPPVNGKCSYNECTASKTCKTVTDQPVCADGTCSSCYSNQCRDGHDEDCGGDSCFLAGTKITMADGTEKNIEEIKEGDKVLSYDVQSQKEVINTVKEPYSVVRDSYYIIKTTSGREIRVTGEHPFYTGDRSQTHKSLIQKASAFVNIMYIYMLDGWQVVKERFRVPYKIQ